MSFSVIFLFVRLIDVVVTIATFSLDGTRHEWTKQRKLLNGSFQDNKSEIVIGTELGERDEQIRSEGKTVGEDIEDARISLRSVFSCVQNVQPSDHVISYFLKFGAQNVALSNYRKTRTSIQLSKYTRQTSSRVARSHTSNQPVFSHFMEPVI